MMRKPTPRQILKAIDGSIEKWERIVAGTGEDWGVGNCPLCILLRMYGVRFKCPASGDRSNCSSCSGTPYDDWSDHDDEHLIGGKYEAINRTQCPTCLKLAKKELAYLKRVKKKYEKKHNL